MRRNTNRHETTRLITVLFNFINWRCMRAGITTRKCYVRLDYIRSINVFLLFFFIRNTRSGSIAACSCRGIYFMLSTTQQKQNEIIIWLIIFYTAHRVCAQDRERDRPLNSEDRVCVCNFVYLIFIESCVCGRQHENGIKEEEKNKKNPNRCLVPSE